MSRWRRWVRAWWDGWRDEPVVLASPRPLPAVRHRLAAGLTSNFRYAFGFGAGSGGYRIVGSVGDRRLRLQAARVFVRNSWRPLLRGHLAETPTGCRLVGTLGVHPFTKVLGAVWLGGVGLAWLAYVAVAVVQAVVGDWDEAGQVALGTLVPFGFVLFFLMVNGVGRWLSRGEADYLRAWLADRLQAAPVTS